MLNDVTIFDFETTGLNAKEERVIEMAALRVINGEIVTEFETLVRLDDRELPPKITEITGIRPEMLDGAMDEAIAFKILRNIMGDSLLVAHNAAFDLQFLHLAMQRIGGKTFSNSFLDTMTISRERHYYPHKLSDMCSRYGITLDGAHRALNDVRATWELLMAMHLEDSVEPFVNRLGYLSKYGPPPWAPAHAELFPTENRYEPRNAG
jgi:DNA polymerase-3 subunit epsilon